MKISLIMLTYNRESQVTGMLSCVKNQTYRDFEFIIINNGSNDGTKELLEDYEKEYEGIIKVITPDKPQSIGAARNIGIKNASGEFVAFVDDDDLIEEDYLEYLSGTQEKYQADFVTCGADEIIEGVKQPHIIFDGDFELSPKEALELYLKREKIRAGNPTKLVKRSLYVNNPFREEGRHEDIRVTYRLIADANKVIITGIPKYHIIRNNNNQTSYMDDWSKLKKEQLEEYLDAYKERTEYIDKRFPELFELNNYSRFSYMLSMVEKVDRFKLNDCIVKKDEMKNILIAYKKFMKNCSFIKDFELEWIDSYLDE